MKDKLEIKLINIILYVTVIAMVYLLLDKLNLITQIFNILAALFPLYLGIFIAWMMRPLGRIINKRTKFSLKTSNLLAILVNLLVVLFILLVIIPLVVLQLAALSSEVPRIISMLQVNAEALLGQFDISGLDKLINFDKLLSMDGLQQYASLFINSFSKVVGVIFQTAGAFFQVFIAYIIAVYIINDFDRIIHSIIKLISGNKAERNTAIARDISKTLFNYYKGLFLDCTFVFIILAVGLKIIGIENALLFAFLAAIFNIIPYVGPIIGGLPIMVIALSIDVKTFILAILVIFGTQFIESNFIQPKIMAKALSLHPASIIVGLIVLQNMIGMVGMLFAIPIVATINVLLKYSKYDITL